MSFWIRVCGVEDLVIGQVKVANIGADAQGLPFQAMMLRDEQGTIQAYRNHCQHLPVPLDGGTRRFLTDDKKLLICRTHGATYRLHDGLCIDGPCKGMNLMRLDWEDRAGDLYVRRP